jgi:hypothetical protein
MNISFSIQLLAGLCVLGFLLWDRTRLQAQIRSLSQHQANTDSSLNQFMQECESTLDEFSRLSFSGNVSPQQGKLRPFPHLSSISPCAVQTIKGQAAARQQGGEKREQILRLAGKGASISEIANQLRIPRGEVDLIVSLNQDVKAVGGKN